jgi:selenocysteine lyase/cysteine desulfurase
LGCDFLVCSAYKFFGPHLGALYGRYDLLDKLEAYRVRPAPSTPPGKFETGTGNFEHMAGLSGALDYLKWVGETFGSHLTGQLAGQYHGRTLVFKQAMSAIRDYELTLSQALLAALQKVNGLRLYGITDVSRLHERVPTFSFTLEGLSSRQVAERLDRAGISVWDGNFYALAVSQRLGLEDKGGMVRVGATHYNTLDEVQKLGEALQNLKK